jgi:hypothetical protein
MPGLAHDGTTSRARCSFDAERNFDAARDTCSHSGIAVCEGSKMSIIAAFPTRPRLGTSMAKKPAAMVRRTNRAGLDAIATGLRRDGVAVF